MSPARTPATETGTPPTETGGHGGRTGGHGRRTGRPGAAASLILLASVSATAPGVEARPTTPQEDPRQIIGTIRYKLRGPEAGYDGHLFMLYMTNVGTAAMVQGSASMVDRLQSLGLESEGLDSLRIDRAGRDELSGLDRLMRGLSPINAHYEATVDFRLRETEPNQFVLEEGWVTFNQKNDSSVSGDGVEVYDKFSSTGSYRLDPATSEITVTFLAEGDEYLFELGAGVSHPMELEGDSLYSTANGAQTMHIEYAGGERVVDARLGGISIAAVGAGEFLQDLREFGGHRGGFVYGYRGSLDDFSSKSETWQSALGGQVAVTFNLAVEECHCQVLEPGRDARLVFDEEGAQEKLEGEALAGISVEAWGDDLLWTFPEIEGSAATFAPEGRTGREVEYAYTMPAENAAFGDQRLEVRLQTERLRRLCRDAEPRPVRFLFARDGTGNPSGAEPNWFHYWRQTSAAQGHRSAILYDPSCDEGLAGYFSGYIDRSRADFIYICDPARLDDQNPVTRRHTEGIDTFASTVRHEWQHKVHYDRWWRKLHDEHPAFGDFHREKDKLDRDGDDIPDHLERGLAPGFSPRKFDTYGIGYSDEHYLTYRSENDWRLGTADREDWASPGKQSGS